jgi:hypothetical protein
MYNAVEAYNGRTPRFFCCRLDWLIPLPLLWRGWGWSQIIWKNVILLFMFYVLQYLACSTLNIRKLLGCVMYRWDVDEIQPMWMRYIGEWLERLTAMPTAQQSWVQYQHPPTQWNLRGRHMKRSWIKYRKNHTVPFEQCKYNIKLLTIGHTLSLTNKSNELRCQYGVYFKSS